MVYYLFNPQEEIKKARELFDRHGKSILNDTRCFSLLDQYKEAIEDSWKLMRDLGVVNVCSQCAEQKPGGCCYFGVETWYFSTVFLMNFLLDVEIPETRMFDNNCLFVGEQGCRLKARFKTCVHHLCKKIKDSLDEDEFFRLRAVTNYEIKLGVQTESAIRDWIREQG